MDPNLTRLTFALPRSDRAALDSLAAQLDMTPSQLARRGVRMVLRHANGEQTTIPADAFTVDHVASADG